MFFRYSRLAMLRFVPFLLLTTLLLASSCDTDDNPPADGGPQPTGALVKIDGCKQFIRAGGDEKNRSCLNWTYDASSKRLELIHENAGFNCCPKSINAAIEIEGQIITVSESEIGPDCRCNCLYDLHLRIENVTADSYVIRFIEPYKHKDDDELVVPVDLRTNPTGSHCVRRFNYPWGV
jgi:hypothetical protein